jgi:TonB family protein
MASILVVGQEQRSLERFHRVLSAEGWRVRVAQGRAQALQAAALEPPDLVLAGAEMDGAEELAGAFRRSSGGPGIVVVMSEAGTPTAPAVLGDDRLRLPFGDQDLVAAVRRMLAARTGTAGPVAQPVRLTSQEIFGDVLAEVEGELGQPVARAGSPAAGPGFPPLPAAPPAAAAPLPAAQGSRPSPAASRADSEIQRKLEKTLSGLMGGDPRSPRSAHPAGSPAAAGAAAGPGQPGRRAETGGGAAEIEALLSKTLSELGPRPRHAAAATPPAAAQAHPGPAASAPAGSAATAAKGAGAAAAAAIAPAAGSAPAAAAAAAPSGAPAATPPAVPAAPTIPFDRRAVAVAGPASSGSLAPAPPPATLAAAGAGLAAAAMAMPRSVLRESPPPADPQPAVAGAPAAASATGGAAAAPVAAATAAPPAPASGPPPAASSSGPAPTATPAPAAPSVPSSADGTGVRRRLTGELALSQIEELARTRRKVEPSSRPGVAVPPPAATLTGAGPAPRTTPPTSLAPPPPPPPLLAAPGDSPAATQRIQMVPRERPEPAGEKFGQYTLLERIAVGGMAEVWKARMRGVEGFQKTVAIKKILPYMTDNADFVGMFIDEAKLAAQLSHPNIIHIYDLGKIGADFYIAMEYVEGKDLRSLLNAARQRGKPLPLGLALLIAMRLASALDYAHRKRDFEGREMGLVHRDVSPQNVLISFDGDVKLCDFGIAKAVSKVGQTQMGALKGKLQYMSPEQARGTQVDARSDIFSLGAVLFEMLTGQRLFDGDSEMSVLEAVRQVKVRSPRQVDPNVPREVDDLVMHALAGRPEDRYQTAGELEQRLEALLYALKPSPSHGDLAAYVQRVLEPAAAPTAAVPGTLGSPASRSGRTPAPVPQPAVRTAATAAAAVTSLPPLPQVAEAAAASHDVAAPAPPAPAMTSPHEVAPLAPLAPISDVRTDEGSRRGRLLLAAAVVALVLAGLAAFFVVSRRNAGAGGAAAAAGNPAGGPGAGAAAGNASGQAAPAAGKNGPPGAIGAIGASGAGAPGAPKTGAQAAGGKVDVQGAVDQEVARRAEELKKKLEEQQKQLQKELDKSKTAKAENAGGPAASTAGAPGAPNALVAPSPAAGETGRGQQKPPVSPAAETRQAAEPAANPPAAAGAASSTAAAAETARERAAEPAGRPQPEAGAGSAGSRNTAAAAAAGGGPTVLPKLVSTPKPEYPALARRLGVQGTVVLQVLVDEQGNVEDVQVLEPISQSVGINEAAVQVARGARYKPGTRNGDRVKMWTRLRIPFKL